MDIGDVYFKHVFRKGEDLEIHEVEILEMNNRWCKYYDIDDYTAVKNVHKIESIESGELIPSARAITMFSRKPDERRFLSLLKGYFDKKLEKEQKALESLEEKLDQVERAQAEILEKLETLYAAKRAASEGRDNSKS